MQKWPGVYLERKQITITQDTDNSVTSFAYCCIFWRNGHHSLSSIDRVVWQYALSVT